MIDNRDRQLLEAVQTGLPVCPRPYAAIGTRIAMPEQEVIERLIKLQRLGLIKRLGVVVKHKRLGYRANAMVVWDIPDDRVKALGAKISAFDFVTLCYQRPRHLPEWPYNLYCMIHGKDRGTVLEQLDCLCQSLALTEVTREVLFSRRCFKQRGARYPLEALPTPALAYG